MKTLCNRVSFVALTAVMVVGVGNDVFAQSSGSSALLNSPSSRFGRNRSVYGSRPAYSPYLNLLRPGNTALNYYGLVRPEQEFRSTNQQFQQQFREVDRKFESFEQREGASNLGVTGHRTRFFSDQHGGAGSVTTTLTDRDQQRQKLPPNPGSRVAPSGHSAYFSNYGTYYAAPGRQ